MPLDEGANICFQQLRRGMDAATKLLPGEFGEPALDLIGPRGRCWCEAHIIVRLPRQLGFDHARFVSSVIDGVVAPSTASCARVAVYQATNTTLAD